MAGCFDEGIGEMGECQACELLVQYRRSGKMDEAPASLTNNALLFMDVVMKEETPSLEESNPFMTPKKEVLHPSEKDSGGLAQEGDVDTHQPKRNDTGTPKVDPGMIKSSEACHEGFFKPTPNSENSPNPHRADQSGVDLDDLGYSPDTKSLLRRKRALDSIIKGRLPTVGGESGEKNNSSRGPAFPKKRSAVHRMARELDEKVKLGICSFLSKPDSASHIRNYLLAVGQETEVAKVERLPQAAANRAQSDRSAALSLRTSSLSPRIPAHVRNRHDHTGINPIHSAPLIDMVNHEERSEVILQGDITGFDPRGQWNRTSSEESANSEEMDRGRMKTRKSVKDSGDTSSKTGDPTLQGVGKGRLNELLTFYEKLEDEALKSGNRSVLFRPPYPCPASKVWRKRSRSCAPKRSPSDSVEHRIEPRSLTAEDADLCQALERMVGDSDVDESMRTAFLSVIKEMQDQAEADSLPQQGSSEQEQQVESTETQRNRSEENEVHAAQEAEAGFDQETWTDPDRMELLPCMANITPDCQRFLDSLENEYLRNNSWSVPQYRDSQGMNSKTEKISKVISFVIALLGLVTLGTNGAWALSRLFK